MNESSLSGLAILVNHLWQSTLFAVAIGGLTLLLRRNSARVRYWLWLAASLKFLVPFALLAALGTLIPWHPVASEQGVQGRVILNIAGTITAPMAIDMPFPYVPSEGAPRTPDGPLPLIMVFAAWALGAALVSLRWLLRWLDIRRALRNSAVMLGLDFPAPVRVTTTQLEPGVVGVFRPTLLLPAGIDQRLTPEQMRAVLAHERCHLLWRDNFTASLHMRVEILFWFYPLVWWIGSRLIEERERACDEQVIRDGHAAKSYAEGILAVCEHYIASRLPSVSGVSGADLRQRIERIVKTTRAVKLDGRKKFILATVVGCTVAAPIAAGMVAGTTWQVLFSLKPYTAAMVEYFGFTNATLEFSTEAMSVENLAASTCPAPTSIAAEQRRKALAAIAAKLSPTDGDKVLLYAVAANSTADVQRLLAGGAPRKGDGFLQSNSLMHIAAQFSEPPMLAVLANAGLSVDGWSGPFGREGNGLLTKTPLMAAISAGRRDNVTWLIQHGADVDATNEAGLSALIPAMVTCRDQQLVTQLIQAGARPNARAQKIAAYLKFNLSAPAATNTGAPAKGKSLIYQRAEALAEAVIGAHAEAGICPGRNTVIRQKQDNLAATVARLSAGDGERALLFAVMANSTADVRRLLAEGASKTGDQISQLSLLHSAAQFGEPPMLEALVRAGFRVEDSSDGGTTAQHLAAVEGQKENLAWLIQHGADVNARNEQGASVLTYAALCKDQDLIDTLIRAGARPDMGARMAAANTGVKLPPNTTPVRADELLQGWRVPTQVELNKLPVRNSSPTKYVRAAADLDGDGKPDQAALLIATDESKEALFVKLSSHHPGEWTFAAHKFHRPMAGTISGIAVQEPGRIPNMCDKGYRPCDPAEPRLILEHQGINYFEFEGAASIVYWDGATGKFKQSFFAD
ncbi:MAG: M56 family metallopeptidase [Steroidobacteraceae bacterium]